MSAARETLIIGVTVIALVVALTVVFFALTINGQLKPFIVERFADALQSLTLATRPTFWTARQTAAFILADQDRYIRDMSIADMNERNAPTHRAIARTGALAATSYTDSEQSMMTRAAAAADELIVKMDPARYPDLDLSAIAIRPWVFALCRGRGYEDGSPHSRKLVIFLSTDTVEQLSDIQMRDTLMYLKVQISNTTNGSCKTNKTVASLTVDPRHIREIA